MAIATALVAAAARASAAHPHAAPADIVGAPAALGSRGAILRSLEAKNRSSATVRAYEADVRQLRGWPVEHSCASDPERVTRADITGYFAALRQRGLTGITRARNLAAIREFFRFLEETERIPRSPCTGVATPKKEQRVRTYLRPDEYTKLLSLAGGSPRDYAILQVFLQTEARIGELCALSVDDVDLEARTLIIRAGKGMRAREIEPERKGVRRSVGRIVPEQGRLAARRTKRAAARGATAPLRESRAAPRRTACGMPSPRTRRSRASAPSSCSAGSATPTSTRLSSTCTWVSGTRAG